MRNRLREIEALGQSIWIDNISRQLREEIKAAGVDFDKIVLQELVDEGVKSFSDSYESLLDTIKDKASELVHAG